MVLPAKILFDIISGFSFLLFWSAVFATLYHLIRFGVGTQPKKIAALLFFGSLVVFGITVTFYQGVDIASLL